MKSPFTGKTMSVRVEPRTIEFRKEKIEVMFHYYWCEDTAEQFTSTELDILNMEQVYNKYRDVHNLPFPDEIKKLREKYDLAASKMSDILGFGINSYRNYENGEVPSNANGKLIQLANDPVYFKKLIEISDSLSDDEKHKIIKKIDKLIQEQSEHKFTTDIAKYLLEGQLPDEYSGYRTPNIDKLKEMIVFFTEQLQPWKTKMNKLLFYADFLMFKQTCYSISGARYRAINMGPVPNNFNSIFEYVANNDDVDIYATEFDKGTGEQFKPNLNRKFNESIFTQQELEVLNKVAEVFKATGTKDIIEISHTEKAWIENEKEHKIISYKYAFDLKGIR